MEVDSGLTACPLDQPLLRSALIEKPMSLMLNPSDMVEKYIYEYIKFHWILILKLNY